MGVIVGVGVIVGGNGVAVGKNGKSAVSIKVQLIEVMIMHRR